MCDIFPKILKSCIIEFATKYSNQQLRFCPADINSLHDVQCKNLMSLTTCCYLTTYIVTDEGIHMTEKKAEKKRERLQKA